MLIFLRAFKEFSRIVRLNIPIFFFFHNFCSSHLQRVWIIIMNKKKESCLNDFTMCVKFSRTNLLSHWWALSHTRTSIFLNIKSSHNSQNISSENHYDSYFPAWISFFFILVPFIVFYLNWKFWIECQINLEFIW